MSERNVKRLMIFVITFLPLQYAAVGIVGAIKSEPWPALVLPAFKSVFSKSDKITISQVKFYVQDNKNEKLKEIQPQKLFNEIPESQLQGFLRTYFFNAATVINFNHKTRIWLKKRIKAQNESLNAGRLYIKWMRFNIDNARPSVARHTSETFQHFSIAL